MGHAIDSDFEIWNAYCGYALFTGTNALLDRAVCSVLSVFTNYHTYGKIPYISVKFLILYLSTLISMWYNIIVQIWFIGRTLASQAGKAGSIPVICFFLHKPELCGQLLLVERCTIFGGSFKECRKRKTFQRCNKNKRCYTGRNELIRTKSEVSIPENIFYE